MNDAFCDADGNVLGYIRKVMGGLWIASSYDGVEYGTPSEEAAQAWLMQHWENRHKTTSDQPTRPGILRRRT